MPGTLISSVAVTPTAPRPAEPVNVEVLGLSGTPLTKADASVTINGIPGAVQHLQFRSPGMRRLIVRATADEVRDSALVPIEVAGTPLTFKPSTGIASATIALLTSRQSAARPYEVDVSIGSPQQFHVADIGSLVAAGPLMAEQPSTSPSFGRLTSRGDARGGLFTVLSTAARRGVSLARTPMMAARRPGSTVLTSAVVDLAVDRTALEGLIDAMEDSYEWDFGDGTSAVTKSPSVTHDFFAGVDHQAGYGQFVVSCRIVKSNLEVRRTLTVHSAYAVNRRQGTIVPHTVSDIHAHKKYLMFTAALAVNNVEDEPMTLDKTAIVPLSENAQAAALPGKFMALASPVVVAPHSASVIGVNTQIGGIVPVDAPGFTVYYAGEAAGLPVRFSVTFEVPISERDDPPKMPKPRIPALTRKRWPWELVMSTIDEVVQPVIERPLNPGEVVVDADSGTIAVQLPGLTSRMAAMDRDLADRVLGSVFSPVEAMSLEARAMPSGPRMSTLRLPRLGTSASRGRPSASVLGRAITGLAGRRMIALSGEMGPPEPGPVAEGQICDPENLTEEQLEAAEAGQLVCQLTDEVIDVLMPGRFMNGRKGDVVLSPGGTGLIGTLLRTVSPAQFYSHSGIMTRNYDEVTHSTASEGRLMDYKVGWFDGSDGIEPRVVKYMWPGVVAQSVEAAIHGEPFVDPENGKSYSISSFSPHAVGVSHNGLFQIVPSLIVKPDPMQETPAIRTELHKIANDARSMAGTPGVASKSHYRLFCYTDPTIGLATPAPGDAGWAAGTLPTVCSSFIWREHRLRDSHLEADADIVMPGDLEPTDLSAGAFVKPNTPDGLYTYTAEERQAAGEWLWETIHYQAFDDAGWFGEFMTDAADDVANQIVNTFASDDAQGKDNEDWRNTTDANAVSPDNILLWDAPAVGGLYGYSEPLQYREPRKESYVVSRWVKVLTRGNLRGTVTFEGAPVGGALVQVYEGKTDFTDANGKYELLNVPFGTYMLKASKVIDGVFYSTQVTVNLQEENGTVDLALQPPPDRYRLAQIYVDFWGKDEESWPDSHEYKNPGPEYFELELGPDRPVNHKGLTYKWGGELRMEYDITVRLLVTNVIDVEVRGTMYEGTSESNDDLDGTGVTTFQVPLNDTKGATLVITNTDEGDDDRGELAVSVHNAQNTA